MELWIRGQDRKSLIKTTIVKYDRDYSNKAIIQGATNEDNYYTELGKYKNKERALEVLDEIQELLEKPQQHIEGTYTYYMPNDGSSKIYEMPKE